MCEDRPQGARKGGRARHDDIAEERRGEFIKQRRAVDGLGPRLDLRERDGAALAGFLRIVGAVAQEPIKFTNFDFPGLYHAATQSHERREVRVFRRLQTLNRFALERRAGVGLAPFDKGVLLIGAQGPWHSVLKLVTIDRIEQLGLFRIIVYAIHEPFLVVAVCFERVARPGGALFAWTGLNAPTEPARRVLGADRYLPLSAAP